MSRVLERVTVIALCLLGSLLACALATRVWPNVSVLRAVRAQENLGAGQKLVRAGPQTRMDAVVITKVTVGDQEIHPGMALGPEEPKPATPFEADDDWLENMTIYLFNRTTKTIVCASVVLGFPETGNGRTEPQWLPSIKLGRAPANDLLPVIGGLEKPRPLGGGEPISFLPHKTLTIRIGDYMDQIEASAGPKLPLSQITRCDIHLANFFFEDGMWWQAGGGFSVPDPDHPGKFIHLDMGRFFPGDPGRNWPPPQEP